MWLKEISGLVFGIVLLQVFSSAKGDIFRIIDGRPASTLEFPFVARLEKNRQQWCGGSILNERFILTAAHCIKFGEDIDSFPPSRFRVRVGSDETVSGGQVYKIRKVIPHADYVDNAKLHKYDIGLVYTEDKIVMNDRVKPVPLIRRKPQEGEMAWIVGYGRQEMMRSRLTRRRHLMAVELPIVSLDKCSRILRQPVADDMICAGNDSGHQDSCTGDSGGPLTIDGQLAGAVSWGIGCGREGLPGVYTSVFLYKDWIYKTMKAVHVEE